MKHIFWGSLNNNYCNALQTCFGEPQINSQYAIFLTILLFCVQAVISHRFFQIFKLLVTEGNLMIDWLLPKVKIIIQRSAFFEFYLVTYTFWKISCPPKHNHMAPFWPLPDFQCFCKFAKYWQIVDWGEDISLEIS